MQLQFELAVPADYFFTELTKATIYEIQCCVGRNVSAHCLQDFAYRKLMPSGKYAHYIITDYTRNERYAYRMQTGSSAYTVTYQVEPLGAGQMRLSYVEELNSLRRLNNEYGFFRSVAEWLRERSFTKMSLGIERAYRNQLPLQWDGLL